MTERVGRARASEVLTQHGVADEVVTVAGAELCPVEDALTREAGLLERALLGHVVDVGARPDPVNIEEVE